MSKRDVDNQLSQMQGRNDVCVITTSDVATAVSSLKHGKCDGFHGLTSDHVLHAGQTFMAVNYGTCLMYQCSHCVRHGI